MELSAKQQKQITKKKNREPMQNSPKNLKYKLPVQSVQEIYKKTGLLNFKAPNWHLKLGG